MEKKSLPKVPELFYCASRQLNYPTNIVNRSRRMKCETRIRKCNRKYEEEYGMNVGGYRVKSAGA